MAHAFSLRRRRKGGVRLPKPRLTGSPVPGHSQQVVTSCNKLCQRATCAAGRRTGIVNPYQQLFENGRDVLRPDRAMRAARRTAVRRTAWLITAVLVVLAGS